MTDPSAGTVSVADTLREIAATERFHGNLFHAAHYDLAVKQLDAAHSRVRALEEALQQAADLIAIPASYHEVAPTGITGMPLQKVGQDKGVNASSGNPVPELEASMNIWGDPWDLAVSARLRAEHLPGIGP